MAGDSHSIPCRKFGCVEFFKFVFYTVTVLGLVCLLAWFMVDYTSMISQHVNVEIEDVYAPSLVVPALNKATTFNTSVFVDLKFKRSYMAGFRHNIENFWIDLFYGKFWSASIKVGTHMVQKSSMGPKMWSIHVKTAVETVGIPWEEASRVVSGGNVVWMIVSVSVNSGLGNCTLFNVGVAVDASGHVVFKNDDV